MTLSPELRERIQKTIDDNEVVLFMKGTRTFPQCGFSAAVVQILDEFLPEYATVNVLEDPQLRQGIKEFSDWPTIPQLYVKGEFVGGCDIVRALYASGELEKVLGRKPLTLEPPKITLTDAAVAAFSEAEKEAEHEHLRLEVSPSFQYALSFGPRLDGDVEVESNGYKLLLDRASARRANGMIIDYVDGPEGAGFKIDNPNEPPKVQQISAAELKKRMDAGEDIHLIDVRSAKEREIAKIEGAVWLDEKGQKELEALPKDATLVFYCRTGHRSQAAAEHYLRQGFTNVYNLAGGIHAWSREVDPSIPRY